MADLTQRFPLTKKQRAFVDEFQIDHNASAAAVRAGYSDKAASSWAYQLLRNPSVAHHIEARAQAAAEKAGMSAAEVLRIIALQAKFDLSEIAVDVPGKPGKYSLLPIAKWSEAARMSVLSFKMAPDGSITDIKLADKQAALRDLGRSHGLFKDVIDDRRDGDDELRERLAKSEADLEMELRGGRPRLKAVG